MNQKKNPPSSAIFLESGVWKLQPPIVCVFVCLSACLTERLLLLTWLTFIDWMSWVNADDDYRALSLSFFLSLTGWLHGLLNPSVDKAFGALLLLFFYVRTVRTSFYRSVYKSMDIYVLLLLTPVESKKKGRSFGAPQPIGERSGTDILKGSRKTY